MTGAAPLSFRDRRLPGGTVRLLDLPGEGPPVVFLHGLAGRIENWERTWPSLAGRRVLAADLPGHGDSDRTDAAYDRPFFRAFLASLADAERLDGAVWIGHSMGGWMLLDFAAASPDRVGALVLVSPAWRIEPPVPPAMLEPALRAAMLSGRGARARIRTGPVGTVVGRILGHDKSGAARLAEMTLPWLERPDAERTFRAFVRCAEALLRDPLPEKTLQAVRCPLLSVWGEEDTLCPPRAAGRFAALRSGGGHASDRHERWAGVGHLPMWERPGKFNDLLAAFLRSLSSRAP